MSAKRVARLYLRARVAALLDSLVEQGYSQQLDFEERRKKREQEFEERRKKRELEFEEIRKKRELESLEKERQRKLKDEMDSKQRKLKDEMDSEQRKRIDSEGATKDSERATKAKGEDVQNKNDVDSTPSGGFDLQIVNPAAMMGSYWGGDKNNLKRRERVRLQKIDNEHKKKSLDIVIKRYKDKRFKHPLFGKDPKVTTEDVSFYTVYGWLQSSDRVRREYAKNLFEKLTDSLGGSLGILDEFLMEDNRRYYVKRLDLEKDVEPSDIQELSEKLIKSLMTQKDHFGNDGFLARTAKSNLSYYKNLVKFVVDNVRDGVGSLVEMSDLLYTESRKKTNFELRDAVNRSADEYLATNITSLTLEPILSEIPLILTKSLGIFGEALSGVATFGVSSVCSLFVTGLITAFKETKPFDNTLNYDQLVADLIRGVVTPTSIQKKYTEKVEEIMKSTQSLNSKYDEIVELIKEFEQRVKPQMEKALFMMGKGDGSNFLTFFKRANQKNAASEEVPVVYQMRTLKSYLKVLVHYQEKFSDVEEIAAQMNSVFEGKTPIDMETTPLFIQKIYKKTPELLDMESALQL